MRILITGAGCPGWYSVYKAIKQDNIEIYSCDNLSNKLNSTYSSKSFLVPKGTDSDYKTIVSRIIQQEKIDVVIPLTDPELIPLSLMANTTEQKCKILVSSKESLNIVSNKLNLYSNLSEISPKFKKGSFNVEDFINETNQSSCFIKLQTSYGSRGTKKIISEEEWLNKFKTEKPEGFGSVFPISMVSKLKLKEEEVLLVEELPGQEYSIDCLFKQNGSLLFYGVREREFVRNGICDIAKFITDSSGEFLTLINTITKHIKLKFNINIQVKRDTNNKLKLLEINPRISGSIDAFCSVGYNLPDMGLQLLVNNKIPNILTPTEYPLTRIHRITHF